MRIRTWSALLLTAAMAWAGCIEEQQEPEPEAPTGGAPATAPEAPTEEPPPEEPPPAPPPEEPPLAPAEEPEEWFDCMHHATWADCDADPRCAGDCGPPPEDPAEAECSGPIDCETHQSEAACDADPCCAWAFDSWAMCAPACGADDECPEGTWCLDDFCGSEGPPEGEGDPGGAGGQGGW